jgi:hypothetical protein
MLSVSQNSSFFKDNQLVDGDTVEYLTPVGPGIQLKSPGGPGPPAPSNQRSGGSARRAGVASALASSGVPAPTASPPSTDGAEALCQAVAPFEGGNVTDDQVKAFQKRYACSNCFHLRSFSGTPAAECPSGWHYLAQCP